MMMVVVIRQDGDYNYNFWKISIASIFEIIIVNTFENQSVNMFEIVVGSRF